MKKLPLHNLGNASWRPFGQARLFLSTVFPLSTINPGGLSSCRYTLMIHHGRIHHSITMVLMHMRKWAMRRAGCKGYERLFWEGPCGIITRHVAQYCPKSLLLRSETYVRGGICPLRGHLPPEGAFAPSGGSWLLGSVKLLSSKRFGHW